MPLDEGAVSDEELEGATDELEAMAEELVVFESLLAGSSGATGDAVLESQLAQKKPVNARANFFQCL